MIPVVCVLCVPFSRSIADWDRLSGILSCCCGWPPAAPSTGGKSFVSNETRNEERLRRYCFCLFLFTQPYLFPHSPREN